MKIYSVELTETAQKDHMEIWSYIVETELIANADNVSEKLEELYHSLSHLPERGRIVPEMLKFGITEFREIQHKPYRIIYTIQAEKVFIVSIVDSRRNLETLLQERLLGH